MRENPIKLNHDGVSVGEVLEPIEGRDENLHVACTALMYEVDNRISVVLGYATGLNFAKRSQLVEYLVNLTDDNEDLIPLILGLILSKEDGDEATIKIKQQIKDAFDLEDDDA